MSYSRVIADLSWEPGQGFDPRATSLLSDLAKIRLDPADHRVKLKLQSDFLYPLDADLYVRTRVLRPEAVRKLLIIQPEADLPEGTELAFRLYDGSVEYYWDGGAWVPPGPSDWNTLAEVNANLAAYDVATTRAFAIAVNLRTTDNRVTPVLASVSVLWEGDVDWISDILLDSLTATLQEEAVFRTDLALPPLPAPETSIDLNDYRNEAALVFVDAEAVFDHVADPNHLNNLLDSYNPTTKVLTLLPAGIPAAGVPWLRMTVRASVAWDTNQDFEELGRLPSVALRDAESLISSPYPLAARRAIVREDTGAGVVIPPPRRTTYRIEMEVRTDRSREQAQVLENLSRVLTAGPTGEAGPFLRSRATDELYRMWMTEQFDASTPDLDEGDVRAFRTVVRLEDVRANLEPAEDRPAIRRLLTTWSQISSEAEQRAIGRGAPVPSTSPETFETQ